MTNLTVQKSNAERVSVFLDGEYAFSLDLLVAASLHVGQRLSDEERAEMERADGVRRAYLSAVRQLGVRPRSRREIVQALRRKQFADEAIDAALQRLEAEGLVDDAEFARYWAENRLEFRPRSAGALRFELRQKGVGSADVDAALGQVDDESAAWKAIQSKPALWRDRPAEESERRVLAFLARRGFNYATARRVWRRLNPDAESRPSDDD